MRQKTKDILIFAFAFIVISTIAYITFLFFYVQKKYAEVPEEKEHTKTQTSLFKNELDTILERNDYKKLDLTRHQLFIDTTKIHEFYKSVSEWNNGLNLTNRKLKLADIPTKFITLRKLDDNFVLYDRCDGSDPRFVILDSTFIIYGPLEKSVEAIEEISFTEQKIELKGKSENTKITIEKTDSINVYEIKFENHWLDWIEYATPASKINNFELVVNHCPVRKVTEFSGFD